MKISTRGRYATRAMLELAIRQESQPVRLKDIADAQRISIKYLENLFRVLKNAKLVVSVVGKNGGYRLAKSPSEIKVLDILEVMEGDLAPVECVTNDSYCQHMDDCVTHCMWEKIYEAVKEVLGAINLQNLIDQCHKKDEAQP
jgi:Rrf2 family protein